MTRKTFEYFDYEPSDHSVDGNALISSLVVTLVLFLCVVAFA